MKSLYEILEISPDADTQQIRLAYISHLKQIDHAQANCVGSEAAVRLHAVKEAYGILSSDVRRKRYDSKLRRTAVVSPVPAMPEKASWGWPAMLMLLLTAGSFYYYHQKLEEQVRADLNVARAEANARRAQSAILEERAVIDTQARSWTNSTDSVHGVAQR